MDRNKAIEGALLVLAGVVLELASRELGGPGALGLVAGQVCDAGLASLGVVPVEGQPLNGAGAVEHAIMALRWSK